MTEDPMHPDDPTHGGAHWCEEHQRWECTRHVKRSRGGGRCHGWAIAGLDACRMHVGKRVELARAEGEAVSAWSALSGKPVVSHVDAVLGMLQMAWLRAHFYAGLLEAQVASAQAQSAGSAVRELAGSGDDEDDVVYEGSTRGAPPVGEGVGLIGHTYSGVKDIGVFATGEALRGLTQLEAQERDRCVKYAKTAHDMGIADAQVRLAEQQGALLAGAVSNIADALQAAVLGALGRIEDPAAAELAAARVRDGWSAWVTEIVPRELRAVAGRSDAA